MINITINLNHAPNIDLNNIAQEIGAIVTNLTGQHCNSNVNTRDDYSTSPVGIYKTQEYLKLRGKI